MGRSNPRRSPVPSWIPHPHLSPRPFPHCLTLAPPQSSPSFLVLLLFTLRPQGEASNEAVVLTVSDHHAAPFPPAHPGHLDGGSHLE